MNDWRESAACRGVGPGPFFPSATGTHHRMAALAAIRTYCDRCDVRDHCLAAGDGEHGVWGGRVPIAPSARTKGHAA